MSPVLILCVYCVFRVYRGSIFFSLVLILRIPAYLGIKGIDFFQKRFFWRSFYIQIGVLKSVSPVQFYGPIFMQNWMHQICMNKFVLVLVQIDLIKFENSNCIRSIWTKTNTNLLHTNLIHSMSRKIVHVVQIVVHQFVCNTSADKNVKSVKNWSPFIPRYAGICRISTKEKKIDPL